MKNLPLNALRALAAVYETGGIRPAARMMDITHSSISRHLKELEAWLNGPLLEKAEGKRSLRFTPQGEKLGDQALKTLRDLEDSVNAIREDRSGNNVTIATTPSIASRWLLPLLSQFNNDHPSIEVSVIADQKLLNPDQEGADFSIRMGKGPWKDLECIPFMDDHLFPVVGRDYWEQHKDGFQLADHPLIHDRDPHASWAAWQKQTNTPLPQVNKGPRYASSDLVLRAAAQNTGVALAREVLAREDLATGNLIKVGAAEPVLLKNGYWIVHPPEKALKQAVMILMNWLTSHGKQIS